MPEKEKEYKDGLDFILQHQGLTERQAKKVTQLKSGRDELPTYEH